jgi:hypothetical protein
MTLDVGNGADDRRTSNEAPGYRPERLCERRNRIPIRETIGYILDRDLVIHSWHQRRRAQHNALQVGTQNSGGRW